MFLFEIYVLYTNWQILR